MCISLLWKRISIIANVACKPLPFPSLLLNFELIDEIPLRNPFHRIPGEKESGRDRDDQFVTYNKNRGQKQGLDKDTESQTSS